MTSVNAPRSDRADKKIYLGGAGGAPTNNVIKSLRVSGSEYLIGASSKPTDLFLADVNERYIVPPATSPGYQVALTNLLRRTKPDFLHFQHDLEIREISRFRDNLLHEGMKLYIPSAATIEVCVDKGRSYDIWQAAGLPVPKTIVVTSDDDLKRAFDTLGQKIWLRATVGGGGKGALPTADYEFARLWIDQFDGWGRFTAAEMLTAQSVTWLSLWYEGELVVAQTRRRKSWSFGDRNLSGVTGITGVAETFSDPTVTRTALDAISAIDRRPHGIFGVDMTYAEDGRPNPTEINIGRFFTTVHFFTEAGLNMPRIYVDIGLYGRFPAIPQKVNPLPDGLLWIRGMDTLPKLVTVEEFDRFVTEQTATGLV